MDSQKQIEYIKQRNANLTKTVQELKDKIEFDETYNSKNTEKAKSLIRELEGIKVEWEQEIENLREKQEQYRELMEEVKAMRTLIRRHMEQLGIAETKQPGLFQQNG